MSECKAENITNPATLKKSLVLSSEFVADLIYNSLLFENRDITLDYVVNVIASDTYDAESKKAVLIKNHQKALDYVVSLINDNVELNENILKNIHQILMDDIAIGGMYRNVDISINGSGHTPPSHIKVYDRMKKYFEIIESTENTLEKIAFSHVQLAKIHPFLDGNGRCARLVMNFYLMKHDYNPVIIPANEKEIYFECLEDFKVKKDIIPFMNYLAGLIKKYN